jgi:hypothetical protein
MCRVGARLRKCGCNGHEYLVVIQHHLEEWQAATEALLLVAEQDGPAMFARIGVMKALNRNFERTLTDRKEMH